MGILGELWVKLGLKNDELKKGLDDSKKEINGFSKGIKKLGGVIAAAFSVKKIIDFTHETAELANKARGVKAAFDKLNAPNLLADLRRATSGTVDDLQLMQRAVQANNFKIPLDQLATYLNFATKRARETGQSVDYLVDSIITGLGRQSVMILDNLGISAAEIRENMKGGASMAEAVGKIIKEQMPDATTEIDKAAVASERLAAAWTNFSVAVGEDTSGVWNNIKSTAADALGWLTRVVKNRKVFGALGFGQSLLASAYYDKDLENTDNGDANTSTTTTTPTTTTNTETEAVKGLIQQIEEEIKAKEDLRNLSVNEAEIRQYNDEIKALKEKLKLLQMTTEEYNKHEASLDKSIKKVEGIFDVPKIKANTDAGLEILNQGVQAWQVSNAKAVEQQAATLEAIEMLNQSITAGITGSLGELANAIAGVNGANIGTVVKALLTPLADAAISAGLLVIGVGKAVEAFKTSLLTLQGPTAIAAGAALIAIGVAAKAGLAAIGNNPTQAGGYNAGNSTSYSGGYGVNTASYSPTASSYTLTTKLQGQDLLLAIQRTQQNNRR